MGDLDLPSLITGQNLLLTGGIFAFTTVLRQTFKTFFLGTLGQRLLPIIPLLLGVAGALGGISEKAANWQSEVMLGMICGFLASNFFKVGKTTVMGIGVEPPDPVVEKGNQ